MSETASPQVVMIVEDSEDLAFILSLIIEEGGRKTHLAHCADDAVAKAAENNPSIAILDIGLPDRDGYQLAKELRASHPTITLVAFTGWDRQKDIDKALASGFDHHLAKPASPKGIRSLFAEIG